MSNANQFTVNFRIIIALLPSKKLQQPVTIPKAKNHLPTASFTWNTSLILDL